MNPVYARLNQHLTFPKTQIAIVYGTENLHSHRFYSYTHFLRENMGYVDLSETAMNLLDNHSLLLSQRN